MGGGVLHCTPLYELWRVRELYTLTQVERHRALTTKFSKAWGGGEFRLVPHQVDPLVLGTFHLFCREMEEHFSVFLHPNGVSAWALQEEAQKLF